MFDFFRKKPQPVQSEQMPIPLPELPAEKNNPVAIESLLKDGRGEAPIVVERSSLATNSKVWDSLLAQT